jgi:predicted PurR-regulated permease PerM
LNSGRHPLTRDVLVRVFFFGAFALIFFQLFLLFKPFLSAALGAAMLAMAFYPLHLRVLKIWRRRNGAALTSTVGVLLLAVLPLAGLAWFFIRETADLAPVAQQLIEEIRHRDWPTLAARLPAFLRTLIQHLLNMFTRMNVDLKQVLVDNAQTIGAQVTTWATQVLRNILVMLMNGLILSVALFFAFRDGEGLLQWGLSLVPMQSVYKQTFAKRVFETFRAVVVGSFVTAAAQGLLAMIGFFIAGVSLPVILGIGTSMSAMLGASFLVTVPVALSVMRTQMAWGIFLLVWAIGVVGLIDNFLKPILIGSRARMPFVLIFFSIIGGVKFYGFLGFILGPVLVASFLSFVSIYREEYDAS